ncbi:hypothetical protein EIN_185050 [Entamoeba invadens IP1]|uniref:hypothetical protein n=1 Tax=Entamoeba invadens IP1 TaxID=370355 RepID=UPI0002C3F54D|nr:hypothetical protein EIN_185050 [Entamoeba invadens IP1]ELP94128.1 hypothetical protein EIN_185050 [Entamoeba invadens IP1]|eukprot:XP_004260899.1 hypothetical protein EIN_185050 [Entamoeba invadens IP1]
MDVGITKRKRLMKPTEKLFPRNNSLPQPKSQEVKMPVVFEAQRTLSPPVFLDDSDDGVLTSFIEIDNAYFEQTHSFIKDKNNQIHEILLGDETYINWLSYAKKLDFSQFSKFSNFLVSKYTDRDKRPLVLINMKNFPYKNYKFSDEQLKFFFLYLITRLEPISNTNFSIIYIDEEDQLPLDLAKSLFTLFPRKYHTNLHRLYLVLQPSIRFKVTTTFFSEHTSAKMKIVEDMYDFYEEIPVGMFSLPLWAVNAYSKKAHPIFGVTLYDAVHHHNRGVSDLPIVVECAIQYFSANPDALTTEGIFRLSGNKDKVDLYIDAFNHCKVSAFPISEDPHNVCSVLKSYLQSLPAPLLTNEIGEKVVELFSSTHPEIVVSTEIKKLLAQVPKENRHMLLALVNLARLISEQNTFNRMDQGNLGTIFGPYIYWKDYSMKAVAEMKCVNALFTYLMNNIADFIDVILG